ncbi:Centromere protein P, partial [Galemys pyrenaicus]
MHVFRELLIDVCVGESLRHRLGRQIVALAALELWKPAVAACPGTATSCTLCKRGVGPLNSGISGFPPPAELREWSLPERGRLEEPGQSAKFVALDQLQLMDPWRAEVRAPDTSSRPPSTDAGTAEFCSREASGQSRSLAELRALEAEIATLQRACDELPAPLGDAPRARKSFKEIHQSNSEGWESSKDLSSYVGHLESELKFLSTLTGINIKTYSKKTEELKSTEIAENSIKKVLQRHRLSGNCDMITFQLEFQILEM